MKPTVLEKIDVNSWVAQTNCIAFVPKHLCTCACIRACLQVLLINCTFERMNGIFGRCDGVCHATIWGAPCVIEFKCIRVQLN